MRRLLRQSLLAQLFGGYLLFVAILLAGGLALSAVVQRQLQTSVQTADLALAKAIALETATKIAEARESVAALARHAAVQRRDLAAMQQAFATFKEARPDLDRVYWLDAAGLMQVSLPSNPRTLGADYADERVYQRAHTTSAPFVEPGEVDLTTFEAVVIIAQPVYDTGQTFAGVVVTNLLLEDLSAPLRTVVDDQTRHGQPLRISLLDDRGRLIATAERERLLQPMLDELPGARAALAGQEATQVGIGPRAQAWLYSATPVPE